MRNAVALAVAALVLTFLSQQALPSSARAEQMACAPHKDALAHLADKFHEHVVVHAGSADGRLIEVTASPEGSWTMLITTPDGLSCFLYAGTGWVAKLWPDHEA